ncbi:hypothetical protein B0H13DRAFT_2286753 [Mycena leptocephala]|nr:hypothetical protein B0H13DRAFT_2286753 [Mycena leptocephala]
MSREEKVSERRFERERKTVRTTDPTYGGREPPRQPNVQWAQIRTTPASIFTPTRCTFAYCAAQSHCRSRSIKGAAAVEEGETDGDGQRRGWGGRMRTHALLSAVGYARREGAAAFGGAIFLLGGRGRRRAPFTSAPSNAYRSATEACAYPSTAPRMATATAEPAPALDEGDGEGARVGGGCTHPHPHLQGTARLLLIHLPLNLQLHASASPFPRDSHTCCMEITIPVHVFVESIGTRCVHEGWWGIRAREGGREEGRGIEAGGKAGAVRMRVRVRACAASIYSGRTPTLDPGTKKQEASAPHPPPPSKTVSTDRTFVPPPSTPKAQRGPGAPAPVVTAR